MIRGSSPKRYSYTLRVIDSVRCNTAAKAAFFAAASRILSTSYGAAGTLGRGLTATASRGERSDSADTRPALGESIGDRGLSGDGERAPARGEDGEAERDVACSVFPSSSTDDRPLGSSTGSGRDAAAAAIRMVCSDSVDIPCCMRVGLALPLSRDGLRLDRSSAVRNTFRSLTVSP